MSSRNRRYYWIKIVETFFETDEMLLLESEENGDTIIKIYLKLLLRSIKGEGVIPAIGKYKLNDDRGDRMLANNLRVDVEVFKEAKKVLLHAEILKLGKNGELILPLLKDMVGSETIDAKRKREKKEGKEAPFDYGTLGEISDDTREESTKSISSSIAIQESSKSCGNFPPEKEIDKEIDKDKDIDIKRKAKRKEKRKREIYNGRGARENIIIGYERGFDFDRFSKA